jgi:hypothetical protein
MSLKKNVMTDLRIVIDALNFKIYSPKLRRFQNVKFQNPKTPKQSLGLKEHIQRLERRNYALITLSKRNYVCIEQLSI